MKHTEHGESADTDGDPEVVVLVRKHVGHGVDEGNQRDREVDCQEPLPVRCHQLEYLRAAMDAGDLREGTKGSRIKTTSRERGVGGPSTHDKGG